MADPPPSSLWQRIVGLGWTRWHRTGSAFVEGGSPSAKNSKWTMIWDGVVQWLTAKVVATNGTPHEDVTQNGNERGADLEEGNTQTAEAAQAEQLSNEDLQPGEVNLHLPQFTSSAFLMLPTPLPVEDIFFNGWSISAIRVSSPGFLLVSWTLISSIRFGLENVKLKTVFGIPIPAMNRWRWAAFPWLLEFWEGFAARLLLQNERHTFFHRIWWFIYILIAETPDFRQNYVEAWRQRQEQSISISVSDEYLKVPIPLAINDELLLRRLRMFYRMIKTGQGITGLLLPKKLERIDCVEIDKNTFILGRRIETLQLGRYKGTLTSLFHSPELVKDSNNIAKKIQGLSQETVLEFKQTYDLGIISLVLAVPPLGSVIFAVAWILHFVHKEGVDLQVLVASAFTVASYIVTTGALIIAFVAFLDQKKAQNDEMMDRLSQVDSPNQERAQSDPTDDEARRTSTAPAPQATSIPDQPATSMPNLDP